MRSRVALVALAALAGFRAFATAPAAPFTFEDRAFNGVPYRVYRVPPGNLELHWRDASGRPYATFRALRAALERRGRRAVLVMNAGIFDPGGVPAGLHVQGGRELRPLNRRSGGGNFYLEPNGVFLVSGGRARVVSADAFARERPAARLAVQSGPLLLAGGRVHARLAPASASRYSRNGVCVAPDGRVLLAITRAGTTVNLFGFARFLASLGCRDALYLDGSVSAAYSDPGGTVGLGAIAGRYGALFAVTVPAAVAR